MTLIKGGPAGPDGAGGEFQNTTDDDRAALWRSLGGRQGILDGFDWSAVAGQMAMEFAPGSAAVEERDATGSTGTERGYHVYQRPDDGNVTVTFDPADASDRNDAVVIAFCDTEDGVLGTGVSEVGAQIVVVRGVSGVTTPRTDANINDWIGAGGWFRYLDVPIAATDTEVNGANVAETDAARTATAPFQIKTQTGTTGPASNAVYDHDLGVTPSAVMWSVDNYHGTRVVALLLAKDATTFTLNLRTLDDALAPAGLDHTITFVAFR